MYIWYLGKISLRMKIVKIDVDGVIRNMFDNMCDIYNKEFNENLTDEK